MISHTNILEDTNIKLTHTKKFQNVCSQIYITPQLSTVVYNKIHVKKNIINKFICEWLITEINKIFKKKPSELSIPIKIAPRISGYLFNIINTVIFPLISDKMNIDSIDLNISELFCVKYNDKNNVEYTKNTSQFVFSIVLNNCDNLVFDLYPDIIYDIYEGDIIICSTQNKYNRVVKSSNNLCFENNKNNNYILIGFVDYLGGL